MPAPATDLVDPLRRFERWLREAARAGVAQAQAMALVTASAAARPAARMVLLKAFDDRGFLFLTSSRSRKAAEIAANPRVLLFFTWPQVRRQVTIAGSAATVPTGELAGEVLSRRRGLRLGGWLPDVTASGSTRAGANAGAARRALARRVEDALRRHARTGAPLRGPWVGYRVIPEEFAFLEAPGNGPGREARFRRGRLRGGRCHEDSFAGPSWSLQAT